MTFQYPIPGSNFIVTSGTVIPSTSGGICIIGVQFSGQIIDSIAVNIKFNGSGRIFIGSIGSPPVGSGSTDLQ